MNDTPAKGNANKKTVLVVEKQDTEKSEHGISDTANEDTNINSATKNGLFL